MGKSKFKKKKIEEVNCMKVKLRIITFGISVLALISLLASLIYAKENEDLRTVIEINNEEVTVREFMLNYDYDKEKSIDNLIDNKAFLNILKEYGIIESTSYKAFLSSMKNENERRLKAKENNEIIYGPVQYSEKQYYEYILSDGRAELEFIIEEEFREEINGRVQSIYEADIESYRIEDAVEGDIITINFVNEDGSVDESKKEEARKLAEEIRENNNKGISMSFENVYKEKYEFKYENKVSDENYNAELKEKALELQVGQVSEVIEFNGAYHILKCLNRYTQGYEELEVVRDQIFVKEIDLIVDELIKEEKDSMVVKINREVLDKIR